MQRKVLLALVLLVHLGHEIWQSMKLDVFGQVEAREGVHDLTAFHRRIGAEVLLLLLLVDEEQLALLRRDALVALLELFGLAIAQLLDYAHELVTPPLDGSRQVELRALAQLAKR